MKIVRSLAAIGYNKNSIVTVGTFDGVHKAHRIIFEELVHRAQLLKGRSVVVTFEPHPREIVAKEKKIDLLNTFEEKINLIEKYPIDIMFVVDFTYEFSQKSFKDFYIDYIINGVGVSAVIEGHNHQFGRDRKGTMNEIVELGKNHDFTVESLSMLKVQDDVVSSSTIREALRNGSVALANSMLGYEYSFTGVVVRGHGRGRELGYPTANIKVNDVKKLIPKIGVYAVQILVENEWYNGMMSIGKLPTFYDNHEVTTEVNIFDFDKDIYDRTVTVNVIDFTRDQLKFSSVAELIIAMGKDKIVVQQLLRTYTKIH